jgi:hypothetical protein
MLRKYQFVFALAAYAITTALPSSRFAQDAYCGRLTIQYSYTITNQDSISKCSNASCLMPDEVQKLANVGVVIRAIEGLELGEVMRGAGTEQAASCTGRVNGP